MSEETWEQRYERERAAHEAKAKKAWEKTYKFKKDEAKRQRDKQREITSYEFLDWTKETETERKTKTTRFTFEDGGRVWMHSSVSKQQKFLVVSGPLAGKRLVDDNPDYVLYNCAYFNRGSAKKNDVPRVVLVHRSSF